MDYACDSQWPSSGWSGWEDLADRLRPDQIGLRERKVLHRLRPAMNPPCADDALNCWRGKKRLPIIEATWAVAGAVFWIAES